MFERAIYKKEKRKKELFIRNRNFKKGKIYKAAHFKSLQIFCLCCGCLTYPWHLVNSL